jgi:cyclophilin family peptidyl-prolyl cis-trans isomerase
MLRAPLALACLLAVAALALAACGEKEEDEAAAGLPEGCTAVEEPLPRTEKLDKPPRELVRGQQITAVVETNCGPFSIELDTEQFAKTATSFVHLVDEGFYDNTSFSYVDGSVVQGGDPVGDRTGGPGYSVDEAVPFDTEYTRGTVAMAKTAVEPVGRSGSQFFVVYAADAGLPPEFARLGEVTYGMDVIDRIAELRDPGSETGAPTEPVVIDTIALQEG